LGVVTSSKPAPPLKQTKSEDKILILNILYKSKPLSSILTKPDADTKERIENIRTQLTQMNPMQRNQQLNAIEQLIEGSVHLVDIQLPKKAPQGHGRPKGATKKPKTTASTPKMTTTKAKSTASTANKPKTTTRDPLAFKYVEKTNKRDAILAAKIKRKLQREELFKKKDEAEKKKKEKEAAAPTQTRPVIKARPGQIHFQNLP
jgi:hypothetical protein